MSSGTGGDQATSAVFDDGGKTAETSERQDADIGPERGQRTASTSDRQQRKTCILKLDGCHYTIGTYKASIDEPSTW